MKTSMLWTVLAVMFGSVWVLDAVLMVIGHVDPAMFLANGAWAVICMIQVDRYRDKERAADAANRDQAPTTRA